MEVSCGSEEVTLHVYRQEPRRISNFQRLSPNVDQGLSGLIRFMFVCSHKLALFPVYD